MWGPMSSKNNKSYYVPNTSYVPRTIISILYTISFNPEISTVEHDYHQLHFADEETEALRR